jgi:hypothetical protein
LTDDQNWNFLLRTCFQVRIVAMIRGMAFKVLLAAVGADSIQAAPLSTIGVT